MTHPDASRLQTLFASALELPPEARAEFLENACAGDPDLLAELRGLLAVDAQLAEMTARPIAAQLTQLVEATAPAASLSGMRVGAFELREELGRGGMGSVYRAERVDGSVQQQVAIKFVRRELLDVHTRRRFQLERQLMATLQHPNIARLLDAAELADGTPYFVMEYVSGIPITEYCARELPDVRERVALMRRVCGAVAEAHRELIVHRDLKPGNILICDDGTPKLLDFGIAKSLGPLVGVSAGEDTGTAQRYFSPNYAAPEQVTGAPVGIACDIYALGQLLYELLAGCRPFDFSQLSAGQIERLITEVPPAAPSVALARNATTGTHIRPRQLQGDLDGIVMRCLRKAPNERYASVEQLEADLGNYLEGRPVQARGGHRWYRMQKFVRRNKVAVAASLLVVASLMGGIVAFALQARIAQQRAAELEQVSKFQAEMLAQVDPTKAGELLSDDVKAGFDAALLKSGASESERATQAAAFVALWSRVNATDAARNLIDRTILKPAAEAIGQQFKDQPLVEATLRQALAERYVEMGLYDASLAQELLALATRQRVLGEAHPDTLFSMANVGAVLQNLGKLSEAEPYTAKALDLRRRVLGDDNAYTTTSINNMGALLKAQGRVRESEPYYREALQSRRRILGEDHSETLRSVSNLGVLLNALGKKDEAEPLYREALEKRRRLRGAAHPETLISVNNMGNFLQSQGKLSESEPYYRDALEQYRRVRGETSPFTLKAISNLGRVVALQGKHSEAIALLAPAEAETRKAFTGDNATWLTKWLISMGRARTGLREFAAAEANLLEAHDICSHSRAPTPDTKPRCTEELVILYTAWHAAEPAKGYDAKVADWQRKLDELNAAATPASSVSPQTAAPK